MAARHSGAALVSLAPRSRRSQAPAQHPPATDASSGEFFGDRRSRGDRGRGKPARCQIRGSIAQFGLLRKRLSMVTTDRPRRMDLSFGKISEFCQKDGANWLADNWQGFSRFSSERFLDDELPELLGRGIEIPPLRIGTYGR